MGKFIDRYGVMEDFEARTRTNLLDMTFNPNNGENESKVKYVDVDVSRITPRSINQYSQGRIERLAESIRATNNRLIHPIVLVKASDLPEDGEVIQQFINKGIDPKTLDLVIVAGERRFKAWLYLREKEAERIKGEVGTVNRFDTITANILTKKEAAREEIYYDDSNTQARQLTNVDVMNLCDIALSKVDTPEKKRAALVEMAEGSEADIPEDPMEAAKLFNEQEFCRYYIETVLGIENFKGGSLKNTHAILKKCDRRVIDAVRSGEIKSSHAYELRKESKSQQIAALEVLEKDGKEAFLKILDEIKEKDRKEKEREKRNKKTRYSSASACKQVRVIKKINEPQKALLEEMVNSLGGESRAEYDKYLKKFDRFMKETIEFLEQHS